MVLVQSRIEILGGAEKGLPNPQRHGSGGEGGVDVGRDEKEKEGGVEQKRRDFEERQSLDPVLGWEGATRR